MADARFVNVRAAAFLAFKQAGLSDLDEIENFCPIKRRYEPKTDRVDIYAKRFEQFVTAYNCNAPLFESINGGSES